MMESAPMLGSTPMMESTPVTSEIQPAMPAMVEGAAPMVQSTMPMSTGVVMPANNYGAGSYGMNYGTGSYGSVGTVFVDNDGLQGTVISDVVVEGGAAAVEGADTMVSESTEVQAGTGEATAPVPDSTTTPDAGTPAPDDAGEGSN